MSNDQEGLSRDEIIEIELEKHLKSRQESISLLMKAMNEALLNREVSPSETQLKELFQQDLDRWTAIQGGVQFIRDAAFEDLDLALKAEAAFAQIWLDGFNTARELSGAPLVEVDARSLT